MARYAIDALTLLQIAAGELDVSPAHQLVAPNHVRTHALSLLLAAVRGGEMTESAALARHQRLTETKIRVLNDRVSRRVAWDLALEHGWDLADAEYVAVGKLQADALATDDPVLATRASGIVAVVPPTALAAD